MLESLVIDKESAKRVKDIIQTELGKDKINVHISDGSNYGDDLWLVDFEILTDNVYKRNAIVRAVEKTLIHLGYM